MWKKCICGDNCNNYLDSFFDSVSEGFAFHELIYDKNDNPIDYKFLEINNAFTYITGLKREDIIGKTISDIIPNLEQFWIDIYKKISTSTMPANFETYHKILDKYFRVSVFSPVKGQFITLLTDITDLKKINEIMKKHQLLFDNAQDIIFYADVDGNIIDANMNSILKYGYSLIEITNLNVQDLRHNSTNHLFKKQMKEADTNGITFEVQHIKKDGTAFPVEVSVKGTIVDKKRLRIHIVRDISERKMVEEKILYLANYDSLTGIPNRSYLMNRLNLILEDASKENFKFALMLFDIDKFKRINDVYGHDYGDIVLRETAQTVKNTISSGDFVARLGGDEFVIIQPYIDNNEDCSILAKKILESFNTPLTINKVELNIDISIGISIYPDDSSDAENLMRFADKAMYTSKQVLGSSFEFYSNIKNL
jgi:diguanylate cyclase (GGDEF)-like protein/PAS domain S-box-containing protein